VTNQTSPFNPDQGTVILPAPTPVVVPKKKGSRATNALLVVAACVAIGGVAFAAGRSTAPAASTGTFAGGFPGGGQAPNASFNPGGFGGGLGGNAALTISGTVKSIDGTTMTITTANGTDTTVDTSSSTYHNSSTATSSAVQPGATVSVSVTGPGGPRPGASSAPGSSAGTSTIHATDVTVTAAQ
jgi:hypothetical protein